MIQELTLRNSRGDVVLHASSRELDPTAEYWLNGTPAGWYGGYSMRGENTDRLGHGAFPTSRTRSPRKLEVRAKVVLPSWDAANERKRALSAALADGEAGVLSVLESGVEELSATVERDGEVLFARTSPSAFTVSIPLNAPDPVLYGAEQVTFLHPIGTGIGLEYPLYGPVLDPAGEPVLSYGSGISSQDPISNPGNAEAWPVFVVVGDFPSGVLLRSGDRVVEWPQPVVPQSPVRIDMSGSVWVGGTNQTHLASKRQWFSVPPEGTIHPEFEPRQFGSGWCETHLRPAYM